MARRPSTDLLDLPSSPPHRYSPQHVRSHVEVALAAVSQQGLVLESVPAKLRSDREVVLAAVQQNGLAIAFAAVDLKGDTAVVKEACTQNGLALMHASDELKDDRAMVVVAVTQNWRAIEYASQDFQCDYDIVWIACQQDFRALRYSHDTAKRRRECVSGPATGGGVRIEARRRPKLEELRRRRSALVWAVTGSSRCVDVSAHPDPAKRPLPPPWRDQGPRADREFMLRACAHDGMALMYASKELKDDPGVVAAAVAQNPRAKWFAGAGVAVGEGAETGKVSLR